MRFRSRQEAEWWATASSRERVAYFLGVQRGLGSAFPQPAELQRVEQQLGAASKASNPRGDFDPLVPCRKPGCMNNVGPIHRWGRAPIHCPEHRDTWKRGGVGVRLDK